MKLSTRARYGLRICFLFGLHGREVMPLSQLVRQSGLSEKYSEQLLGMLKKAGIVEAQRGSSGGYYLRKDSKDITIREILEALDDGFTISDCAAGACGDSYCPNRVMLRRIHDNVNGLLETMTLCDMIQEQTCGKFDRAARRERI
ncbi:MAG: Rrf2 family transcriptional regulator [Clostridiales bacterium]|jgi:Rrf2 family protein|nr:Rrf2 family transcriptional regulator [Clostridiales bacterium]